MWNALPEYRRPCVYSQHYVLKLDLNCNLSAGKFDFHNMEQDEIKPNTNNNYSTVLSYYCLI